MPYTVTKMDVWSGQIEDRAGGLARKLAPLAEAKADLQFVIGRRQPDMPGKGVVFLAPVTGSKPVKAAIGAGLAKSVDLAALRVEGPNKAGTGYEMTRLLANAGINLRGISASVIGRKFVAFLAFDSAADADRAAKLLRAPQRK